MKLNKWLRQPDTDLGVAATSVAANITASPTTFGLTATVATGMTNRANAMTDANADYEATYNAWRAASATRDAARADLTTYFGNYLKVMYATPTVSNTSIQGLGFDGRSTGGTPVTPQQPLEFIATAFADGHVDFKWNRNGNPYSVSFVLEQWIDGEWVQIFTTTKAKVTLFDYAPGVEATFRVWATRNTLVSLPSNVFTIYAMGSSFEVSAAA